jgi:hypothetical protein
MKKSKVKNKINGCSGSSGLNGVSECNCPSCEAADKKLYGVLVPVMGVAVIACLAFVVLSSVNCGNKNVDTNSKNPTNAVTSELKDNTR